MIYHTIYTMSIARFSLLEATQNRRYVSRIGFGVTKKAYENFNKKINELFNQGKVDELLEKSVQRLIMYNRVQMLESLLMLSTKSKKEITEYYKEQYGQEYNGDKELLINEIEKYKTLLHEPEKIEKEAQPFEEVIAMIERILGYTIDRQIKVYQFQKHYELAFKIIENSNTDGTKD